MKKCRTLELSCRTVDQQFPKVLERAFKYPKNANSDKNQLERFATCDLLNIQRAVERRLSAECG
jgi:hypothetical protein